MNTKHIVDAIRDYAHDRDNSFEGAIRKEILAVADHVEEIATSAAGVATLPDGWEWELYDEKWTAVLRGNLNRDLIASVLIEGGDVDGWPNHRAPIAVVLAVIARNTVTP